ncbi:hypothetical protein SAMN05660733_05345 [Lentzea albidocapillata]|uniref:Uncharacterized protein n=1 Tax=Lentzea albidocapillata TaxID=40571 RepID=A0A1W2F8R3_9PSEU|nr:hypothetical protein SAMN05660733_05345 [Lentzea albidocapillata]
MSPFELTIKSGDTATTCQDQVGPGGRDGARRHWEHALGASREQHRALGQIVAEVCRISWNRIFILVAARRKALMLSLSSGPHRPKWLKRYAFPRRTDSVIARALPR